MRALLITAMLGAGAPLAAQICFDPHGIERIAADEAIAHRGALRADRGAPGRGFDVRYQRLELSVDPAVRAISGTVTHRITALQDLASIWLDLSSPLDVDEVTVDGAPAAFAHSGDSLIITLPAPLGEGADATIAIAYGGVPPETGFGSFVQTTHQGAPVLWTLSEPNGARDWWPCKQDLNDKADSLDLIVTTTQGNRVAGNGLLVAEDDLGNGTVRFHWRHRHPINYYLVAFATTNYTVYTEQAPLPGTTVEILNYVYPESLADAQGGTFNTIAQLQLFSQLFGEYPFADEKYGHAQFSWGGAMEHQTMSFMGNFGYEILAHELAHQWFGNVVTCGSWEDVWLNEGFATYLSGLCYEHLAPQYWMPFKSGRRGLITSQPGGSVLVPDTNDVARIFDGRLTYAKGAYLVHMLRWVCGDDAFFAGVNAYLNDPGIRNGSARTPQLVAHLEEASGKDLTEFMQDWYVGEGFPTYQLTWAQDFSGEVTVVLGQTTSHPSVDFFEMPVPIRFSDGAQEETVVLDHAFNGQSFTFQLGFEADQAVLDPDLWIVTGSNIVLKVPKAVLEGADRFLLYPNPAADDAWLHVGAGLQGRVGLEILDAAGRIVRSEEALIEGLRAPVRCAGLAPGAYTVRITASDGTAVLLPLVKG